MKLIKTFSLTLAGVLLLLFSQSCSEQPGTWKNGQIKPGKRTDFHELTDRVFKDIKARDDKHLKQVMSKEFSQNAAANRTIDVMANHLTDDKYTLLDEYYVVNTKKDSGIIKAVGTDINRYDLAYPCTQKEMYLAFYVPDKGENKLMIAVTYAKFSYGWNICDLQISPYTINGKTGPELLKLAKEEFDKKYFIDAKNTLLLAADCMKPALTWKYPELAHINDFATKFSTETHMRYRFPITFSQLPATPMVLSVYTKKTDKGYFPLVYYMTHINIKDTNAVKSENVQIKKLLYKALPGINKDNKYVFYEAFNRFPSGAESVDRFYMTDKF